MTSYSSLWETPRVVRWEYDDEHPYQVWTSYDKNLENYGPLKFSLKNKEENDKDDIIADVIPFAMGNPHAPMADLWW